MFQNKTKQWLNFFRSNRGFTMGEILIASGLLAGVGLLVVSIIQNVAKTNIVLTKGQNSLYSITQAHYGLLVNLNQAINLENGDPSGFTLTTASSGRIQAYDSSLRPQSSTANAATAANIDTLAVFHKEGRRSQDPLEYSLNEAVGIYFQRPTPRTSGVLYISKSAVNSGAVTLAPFQDNAAFPNLRGTFFPDLTRVEVGNLRVIPGTNRLSGLTITLHGRTFSYGQAGEYRWCSANYMTSESSCNSGQMVPYKDIQRIINISFRNNTIFGGTLGSSSPIGPGSTIEERVLGPVYYFSFSSPRGF